jgi:3-dehydroquinate dehydratase-2
VQVVVLNGANLNAIGHRDPELYGGIGYSELETRIYAWGKELGCSVRCLQTNSEGQFIDWCHEARRSANGLIVNPGAWTHYSYAIRDALELWSSPVVEVHLSDIEKREEWRRVSVIADVVAERVIGKGPEGYREALVFLAHKREQQGA